MSEAVFRIIVPGWELGSLTDKEIAELEINEGASYIHVEGTESVLQAFADRHSTELVALQRF